jgi:hypothetical protein
MSGQNEPMFLTAMLTLAFQQPVGSDQSSNSQDGDGVPADARESEQFHQGCRGTTRMKQLKECSGNSMRTWGTEKVAEELDEAHQKGISLMVGIWLGHKSFSTITIPFRLQSNLRTEVGVVRITVCRRWTRLRGILVYLTTRLIPSILRFTPFAEF